jgi:hypothetical protein
MRELEQRRAAARRMDWLRAVNAFVDMADEEPLRYAASTRARRR